MRACAAWPSSVNPKFSLRRRANQWFIGHWLYHGSRSNVSETRYILRARRTLKTEWRVSQELRSASWSLPVSPIDQRCATAPILLARLGMVGLFGCCRLACQIRLELVARWLTTKWYVHAAPCVASWLGDVRQSLAWPCSTRPGRLDDRRRGSLPLSPSSRHKSRSVFLRIRVDLTR